MTKAGAARKPFDDRLVALDRELRELRKTIRGLERGDTPPEAIARAGRRTPRPRPAPAPAPEQAGRAAGEDLFAYAQRRDQQGEPPSAGPSRAAGTLRDKQKFASYFTSGTFIRSRPLRQERRLQRNKAIFMLFVVVLVAFVVISLLRR